MNISPRAAAASAFWEGKPWMCSTSAALRDRPVSITSNASSLTPRATTERTGMPAWTIACRRFCPSRTRPSSSSLMASPVSCHSPRWIAAVIASMRRRVTFRLFPPRSSHSWASSGVMVTISRSRSAARARDEAWLPLARGVLRVRDVRGLVGLRDVGNRCSPLSTSYNGTRAARS